MPSGRSAILAPRTYHQGDVRGAKRALRPDGILPPTAEILRMARSKFETEKSSLADAGDLLARARKVAVLIPSAADVDRVVSDLRAN